MVVTIKKGAGKKEIAAAVKSFEKKSDADGIPLYSFEHSAFLDSTGNWVETTKKIR